MQTPNPNFQDIVPDTENQPFEDLNDQIFKDAGEDENESEREDGSYADDEKMVYQRAVEDVINQYQTEIEDLKQQVLRSYADLQNFRKRSQQHVEEARKYANEDLLNQLIPVLDNFERTFKAIETGATMDAVLEGIGMVKRQFGTVLNQNELIRIECVGHEFDPMLHEAVITWQSPDHADGVITDELEAGYQLKDRVIRPAKVRVVRN